MKIHLKFNSFYFFFVMLSSLTVVSCSAQTSESINNNNQEDLHVLEYCELVNNPDKYDGKIVRLKAEIKGGQHGDHLYDDRCPADESIYAYYDATAAVIYKSKEDATKIREIRDKRIENKNSQQLWVDPVNVRVIGIFRKNTPSKKDSDYERNATSHFLINSIESFSEDNK